MSRQRGLRLARAGLLAAGVTWVATVMTTRVLLAHGYMELQ